MSCLQMIPSPVVSICSPLLQFPRLSLVVQDQTFRCRSRCCRQHFHNKANVTKQVKQVKKSSPQCWSPYKASQASLLEIQVNSLVLFFSELQLSNPCMMGFWYATAKAEDGNLLVVSCLHGGTGTVSETTLPSQCESYGPCFGKRIPENAECFCSRIILSQNG